MSEVAGLIALCFNVLLYILGVASYVAGLLFARTVFAWRPR